MVSNEEVKRALEGIAGVDFLGYRQPSKQDDGFLYWQIFSKEHVATLYSPLYGHAADELQGKAFAVVESELPEMDGQLKSIVDVLNSLTRGCVYWADDYSDVLWKKKGFCEMKPLR
jgi:hypothetical protein